MNFQTLDKLFRNFNVTRHLWSSQGHLFNRAIDQYTGFKQRRLKLKIKVRDVRDRDFQEIEFQNRAKVREQYRKESDDYQNSWYARNFQPTLQSVKSTEQMVNVYTFLNHMYVKRTSEWVLKVRGLFYVAIWNLTAFTYFL